MKKFFTSLVLALILIIWIGAISVLGEERGQCGENVTWVLENDGILTISGTGEMDDYVSTYSVPWYDYKDNIKECVIEEGIINIGSYIFNGFDKLERVSIPDSVTKIGNHIFSSCTALKSVEIPDNVISIGNSVFVSCTGLTNMTIPDKTTNIGYAAFYGCTGLESVTIPKSLTSIGDNAFSGCSGLKNVYIEDLAAWCNVSLGNSTSNPLLYGKTLYVNNVLTSELQIPEGVTAIKDYVFSNLKDLKSVTIPDSVSSIGLAAFSGCGKLLDVYYLGNRAEWDTVSIIDSAIDFARIHCIDDENIFAPENDFQFVDGAITKYIGNERVVDIPPTIGGKTVKSIGNNAFEKTSVSIVTIPDSVTSIGSKAFLDCNELRSVSMPSNISDIASYTFSNCRNLTEITIPYGTISIRNYAFINCSTLESITIPDSVTGIGYSAFSSCSNIKNVYYSGSQADWEEINIDSTGNTYLTNANIVYGAGEYKTYTFVTNGGTDVEAAKGKVEETPITFKEGYDFIGWYDNADFSGEIVEFPYSGEATTLYARWWPADEEIRGIDYTINSITLRDVSTNSVINAIPEQSFVTEISVTNVSSKHTDIIIIAAYDENGGLLDIDFVYAALGTGESLTFGSLVSNESGKVYFVKAFVRPRLNSLVPLAESIEISK